MSTTADVPTLDRRDRARGALVGLAVGDALGAAVEFKRPGTFAPVTGFRTGGPHRLAAGEWTDDTSMALALADSIASQGWDPADQARRYVSWYRTGAYSVTGHCFDIGNATSTALRSFERYGDPATAGSADEQSAGNGSIMRLAPVPIAYADRIGGDARLVAERSVESGDVTHRAPQSRAACAWMGVALAGLIGGVERATVLDGSWEPAEAARGVAADRRISTVVDGSYRDAEPPTIVGSGYVVDCLEAALWAFHGAETFSDAVLAAVNLGDDSDTTGAVCGQFAGAWFGYSGIPAGWRRGLAQHDKIVGFVDALVDGGSEPTL